MAKKLTSVAQKNWQLRQTSVPDGGSDNQGEQSVADIIKKFEVKDQNKQLMNAPIQKASLVFDRDYPSPPIYEEVLVIKEIHMYKRQITSTDNCEKSLAPLEPFKQPPTKPSQPPAVEKPQPRALQGKMKMLSVRSMDKEEQADHLIKDPYSLMKWWEKAKNQSWEELSNTLKGKGEAEQFTVKAECVLNAVQLYNLLLNTHGETMRNHIHELNNIADNLDKVSKGTKMAGITGGATGAVGGVAAVAGVVFAPFTFGASLAITAIGVGVAAAGGATGASAAIANKVINKKDKKKIELILHDSQVHIDNIEACLRFISMGMEHVRKHDPSTLQGVNTKTLRVFRVAEVTGIGSSSAGSKASGNLEGFTLGMDMYFAKNAYAVKQVNNELRSEFALKIRTIAHQLNEGLKELFNVKKSLLEKELIF